MKASILAIAVLCLCAFSGCSERIDSKLIGFWVDESNATDRHFEALCYQFQPDGSFFKISYPGSVIEGGTFAVKGRQMLIHLNGDKPVEPAVLTEPETGIPYTLTGSSLVLAEASGMAVSSGVFTRKDDLQSLDQFVTYCDGQQWQREWLSLDPDSKDEDERNNTARWSSLPENLKESWLNSDERKHMYLVDWDNSTAQEKEEAMRNGSVMWQLLSATLQNEWRHSSDRQKLMDEQSKLASAELALEMQKAVRNADVEEAERLLEQGADVNHRYGGNPPLLHEAVRSGSQEMVELLLNAGAAVNAVNLDGHSASDIALIKGYDELAVLLGAGAELIQIMAETDQLLNEVDALQIIENPVLRGALTVDGREYLTTLDENLRSLENQFTRLTPYLPEKHTYDSRVQEERVTKALVLIVERHLWSFEEVCRMYAKDKNLTHAAYQQVEVHLNYAGRFWPELEERYQAACGKGDADWRDRWQE